MTSPRALREQPCDGATNLAAVGFPSDASYSLLFSDGLSTVGGGATDGPNHPVFVLSGGPRADHASARSQSLPDPPVSGSES